MPELTSGIKLLIQKCQEWQKAQQLKEGVPTIHVDEIASKVASFYEKIREVIEWKEEHLLRRAAISRILKRRLFLQKSSHDIAESVVLELIRNGHFPNDKIEESKIENVKNALDKYLFIFNNASFFSNNAEKAKVQLYDWLLNVAACEVEAILSPPTKEIALIDYMTKTMKERIEVIFEEAKVKDNVIIYKQLTQKEIETQIYIACQKALFKLDEPIISYYLLKNKYPNWENISQEDLKNITENIYSVWIEIENDLNCPLAPKFYKICEKYDTPFLILSDIIFPNPAEAEYKLQNSEHLESLIKKAYQTRAQKIKSKMARAAAFSTISIFVTKILIAFVIEIPFDKYILGKFKLNSLWFNILIPPALMFFLVLTIKLPKKENLDVVVLETMKIVYENQKKDRYIIKAAKKKGFISSLFIFTFYALSFVFSFGIIFWMLKKLDFSVFSIIIFLIFLSLIAFAGVKIRERAKELDMIEEKPNILAILTDTFSVPFLRVGRWLSHQWIRFNIVVVLITAFIDMPFQVFVEFLENWRSFLKEKREEIH